MEEVSTSARNVAAIRAIGALLVTVGASAGLLATAEMYCYSLFSSGGRFHYDGFGFGSFMFGLITAQNIALYLIALILIVLGYGHMRLKGWTGRVTIALLDVWLLVGAPVVVIALFVWLGLKDPSAVSAIVAAVACVALYFPIPHLIKRFYRSARVAGLFDAQAPVSPAMAGPPTPVLTAAFALAFIVVCLYVLIFFGGIFPVFGQLVAGLPGIILIDAATACLAVLAWGLLKMRQWAYWGAVAALALLAVSTTTALATASYQDLLSAMHLPATEMTFLENIPARGYHFALLAGIPLVTTLGYTIVLKKHISGEAVRTAAGGRG